MWWYYWLVVPGAVGNQAKQTVRSKAVSSMPPWPLLRSWIRALCLLPVSSWPDFRGGWTAGCKLKYTSSFQSCFWSRCFITVIEAITKTLRYIKTKTKTLKSRNHFLSTPAGLGLFGGGDCLDSSGTPVLTPMAFIGLGE